MIGITVGAKNNRLTFIGPTGTSNRDKRALGLFQCECGKTKEAPIGRVKSGHILSCGCMTGKHGHDMKGTRAYESWVAAKRRCLCETDKDYPRYGGKGITFHQPWANSFEQFFKDMGERPEGTTIDRIDTTKGYYPGNCKWSTPTEQAQNTKASYIWFIHGERYESAAQAAAKHNVTEQTIHRWVKGYVDKRRYGKNTQEAKDGCSRLPRYHSRLD